MINRINNILKSKSFFLFGARGTGKTTLLKELFPPDSALWINLLDPEEEDLLVREPNDLKARLENLSPGSWVIIDEIQKAPRLLNIVHDCIETKKIHFGLTGSSSRRLKQKGVNLLAGRALSNILYPFTHRELKEHFDLQSTLEFGSMPSIFEEKDQTLKKEYLRSYSLHYIQHEVQAEQWVRKLEPFRKFLPIAAQMNAKVLNYSKIARDIGVDTTTVVSYFDILEDTYLGFRLKPFHESIRKRQRQNPKFYFFDLGIKRAVEGTLNVELVPQTFAYGQAFEHFVICEAVRLNEYGRKDYRFSYLETKDHAEVDLIVERPGKPNAMIEIKPTQKCNREHTTNLNAFSKTKPDYEYFLFSQDKTEKQFGNVRCMPWDEGILEVGL